MTAIERTAYPRFKQILSSKDLTSVYTPTPQERLVAHRSTKGRVAEVGFLVLLKTYQHLGRFVPLSEISASIIEHIAKPFEPHLHVSGLNTYDTGGTRQRHILLIRALQKLQPYGPDARTCFLKAVVEAGKTKEDLADLITVALDEPDLEPF